MQKKRDFKAKRRFAPQNMQLYVIMVIPSPNYMYVTAQLRLQK